MAHQEQKGLRWLVRAVLLVVMITVFWPQSVQARRLTDLRISPEGGSIYSGQALLFKALGVYDDGTTEVLSYPEVTWGVVFNSLNDPTAAAIDSKGWLIACKAPLDLRIAATQGGTSDRSPLLVSNRAQIAVPAQAKDIELARKQARNLDSDVDGLADRVEKLLGTGVNNADSDGDGYRDGEEVRYGTSPSRDTNLFRDQGAVPTWARRPLFELVARGILQGDQNNQIKPHRPLTRAELLRLIMEVAEVDLDSLTITGPVFKDVGSRELHSRYINHAAALGLVAGYDDGTFRPNERVRRAEAIKLIMDAARLFWFQYHIADNDNSDETPFGDLNADWQRRYLSAATNLNWVSGYADGTFRPAKNITLVEVAKLLNALLDQEPLWDRLTERACGLSASSR